jgi:hypothetical protein
MRAVGLLFVLLAMVLPAAAFDLVTGAEAAADREGQAPARTRSLPVPTLDLLSPGLGKAITSPLDIRLRWKAQAGAAIDPASVKVRYGRFGLDVTSRVLAAAQVSDAGIEAPGARLPKGEHRLTIEVADTQKRIGRREFVVEVAE